jgi:phage-related tail protein
VCNKGKNNADACAESVKRDLQRQNRDQLQAKETNYRGKRDLLQGQKRHTFDGFSGVDNVKVYLFVYPNERGQDD